MTNRTQLIAFLSISFSCFASNAFAGELQTKNSSQNYDLTLGEQTFDPLFQEVIIQPTEWQLSPNQEDGFRLVQFSGPIQEDWISSLKKLNITPIQYIHPYTYITWGTSNDMELVKGIDATRWSGDFLTGYKVLPKFRNLDERPIRIKALAYKDGNIENLIDELKDLGITRIESKSIDHRFSAITFTAPGNQIVNISKLQKIMTIQPLPTDGGLRSEMSSQVNAGNVDSNNQAYPGYADWLGAIGLDGSDVIIAVVDGGVDENHPDFSGHFLPCSGQSCGGSASSGHGTHCAGIVGGTGDSGVTDSYGFLRGMGVAPNVSMVDQVYSPIFTQPGGMTQLIYDSHANGAVASSNSWGPSGSPQGYDIDTLETDIGIRDADPDTPGNQQFSYVLAFMNGNGGTSSQGSPDEAKNIFTIGSTKMRTGGGAQDLNINDLSSNSAHGPALDGRTIPHMVAPGCQVDSTYPGSSHDLLCGTSMACPQVAGAVALFVQQYKDTFETEPSPALIKAAFTAGALNLAGFDDADGNTLGNRFDSKQGWGRMDLPGVLARPEGSVRYFDAPYVLEQTGDEWSTTVSPLDPSQPMKIMLVWTDAVGHGIGGSTPAWNNDLDLTVSTGSSLYRGNNIGSNGWSTTGGPADDRNNTEGVFLGPTAPGQATITVTAANLNSDGIPNVGDEIDQDFSIACYNCSVEPGYSLSINPSEAQVCAPATIDYFYVEVGQIMGYEEEVTLSATSPNGIKVSFQNEVVTPPAVVPMTVWIDSSVNYGDYEITVNSISDDGIEHDGTIDLQIANSTPTEVSLSQPSNNAVDVAMSPTFSWSPVSNADSYQMQVSTTPSSGGIFEDVYNIQSNVYQLDGVLQTNTTYYWRAGATNACGTSSYTSWWSFTTTDAITIMLVDDDDNQPDMRDVYTNLLDANGILYEVFDTQNSNNEPSSDDLSNYPLVIWFTGDEWGGFSGPGGSGEDALSTYINNGGKLFLSSQDYLYDFGLTSFGQNYLGIDNFDSDTGQNQVDGLDLFEGVSSSLNYPFTNYSDTVSPSSNASLEFSGNAGDAAVFNGQESKGGAIFFGFPLEAMSSSAQNDVMAVLVEWIGDTSEPCTSDCNGDGFINVTDVLAIIGEWGSSSGCDVNGDGITNVSDLLIVISDWGECQ